jgi:hypothetical protein
MLRGGCVQLSAGLGREPQRSVLSVLAGEGHSFWGGGVLALSGKPADRLLRWLVGRYCWRGKTGGSRDYCIIESVPSG